MATTHSRVAVLTTATRLDTPASSQPDTWPGEVLRVQNPAASVAPVFIGNASVSVTSYGMELVPGAVAELPLASDDELYAVAAAAGTTINVLRLQA